jgi:proteasome lid subunit RPN8/RPN11
MLAQALAENPLECCGLLAGTFDRTAATPQGLVRQRYPLVNAEQSPRRYESDARSTLDAFKDLERRGLELLSIYHSHPTSAPVPSKTDLERNFFPEVVHLIISLATPVPAVRGWWLKEDSYEEAEWDVVGG